MTKLTLTDADRRLKALPGWGRRALTIRRTFQFKRFMDGIEFVGRVAAAAEASDHHPDVNIRWNKVTLALSTHSEGGLTAKDFSMARKCGLIFSRHFAPR
jgi:4a-hydroxytetrahydrobiopterin dehydratase